MQRNDLWFAQVRRTGHKSISRTFPTKTLAAKWARGVEAEMDADKYGDNKISTTLTLSSIIERYNEEIGGNKGFGRNKVAVLKYLNATLGHHKLVALDGKTLCDYVSDRLKSSVSGVTVNIELTYLKGVLKVAGDLWEIRGDLEAVNMARKSMAYKGVSTKSVERKRRPTQSEIDALVTYYSSRATQILPMNDIIPFAVETAMRVGEICRITWGDLNLKDRTVVIRDRKHPRKKIGNDHTVPLLGDAMAIVLRQPQPAGGIAGSTERIFPYSEKTISSIFPRACQALNIDDLHFHDFRHEGVSRLFEKKYTIEQVSLVSGHEDWAMLKRYLQLDAKDLHRD